MTLGPLHKKPSTWLFYAAGFVLVADVSYGYLKAQGSLAPLTSLYESTIGPLEAMIPGLPLWAYLALAGAGVKWGLKK